jgi:ankyrin repeat protein
LLFKYILKKPYQTNSKSKSGDSPLHSAAGYKKLENCKFIIESANNKNPKDYKGSTHFMMLLVKDILMFSN